MGERFAGMVALVTGGSNGLGRAISQALLAEGALVGILDLQAAASFAGNDRVLTITGDVADPETLASAMEQIVARWGRVDVLVNDAGAYAAPLVVEMPAETFLPVLDFTLTATLL